MIISPVCSFEYVSCGIYDTTGCISISSEYGCDMYTNALEKISSKWNCANIRSYICVVHKQDTLFDAVEFQRKYPKEPFALDDSCLTHLPQNLQ